MEPFQVNSQCQKDGESIAVFIAKLRKIVTLGPCSMLRDRLVCGTNAKGIQHRPLDKLALTFEALKTELVVEAAKKDSMHLTRATNTPDLEPVVNKVG